jgi:8-oxo-dGTP pyrophosphatase MutT (NUDIX family)
MIQEAAFGVVPYIKNGDEHLFLIIQDTASHWSFPKGHAEPGESPEETALRELAEETGITQVELAKDISFTERYNTLQEGVVYSEKTVVFFLGLTRQTEITIQPSEIIDYRWLPFEKALEIVTYKEIKNILTKAQGYIS